MHTSHEAVEIRAAQTDGMEEVDVKVSGLTFKSDPPFLCEEQEKERREREGSKVATVKGQPSTERTARPRAPEKSGPERSQQVTAVDLRRTAVSERARLTFRCGGVFAAGGAGGGQEAAGVGLVLGGLDDGGHEDLLAGSRGGGGERVLLRLEVGR